MEKLKDGRLVLPATLKSAKSTLRMYSMDLETLIGCIIDFDKELEDAGIELETSTHTKYRRGYLIKCDSIYRSKL